MFTVEQFVYGLINGDDLELRTTPKLHMLLTEEELLMLCHIGDKETSVTRKEYWTSKWLSVSYIYPMSDCDGRRANWNHTFVAKMGEYLAHTQPSKLFQNHVIESASELPQKLKPLRLE